MATSFPVDPCDQHRYLIDEAEALARVASRQRLLVFVGSLAEHLAVEDQVAYPTAIATAATERADEIRTLQVAVGSVRRVWEQLLARWPDDAAIAREPGRFAEELVRATAILRERIRLEDRILYR